MIDTIRLTGNADYYRFQKTYERFTGWKKASGEERISTVMVENKKGVHRVFLTPSTNTMVVELNPHKLIFSDNVYNYEKSAGVLNDFVRRVGSAYFSDSSYYVARVDIGGCHTCENTIQAGQMVERFRSARIVGARTERFKQQNYKSSVFYSSKNWSLKLYNKGIEMKIGEDGEERHRVGFDLLSTVRAEKTYRFRELERIGIRDATKHIPVNLSTNQTDINSRNHSIAQAKKSAKFQVTPFMGVHIDSFDIEPILNDFYGVLQNWEFTATPYITEKKGVLGLLNILDNQGLLSTIEGNNTVSRQSVWRYKQLKKKELSKNIETSTDSLTFASNLTPQLSAKWNYYRNFGINSLIC
jgi:hypothetical protein